MTACEQKTKHPSRKDIRFEREAKALQKNLLKRKRQQELIKEKKSENNNG